MTGAAAQAGTATHVEVFSDSGAAAGPSAGSTNYGHGSKKETLADAITFLDAHGGGVITFASSLSGHTIDLATNLPTITAPTTVNGPGADKLAVNGEQESNAFVTSGSAGLTLHGLTVEHSYDAVDGFNGSVTVTDSVLEGNHAALFTGDRNSDAPRVTLSGDTIKDNGYGVYVSNAAKLSVTHCLVEGNLGGINSYGGPTTINSSAIIDNKVGGGITAHNNDGLGALTIVNTTISGNRRAADSTSFVWGAGIFANPGIDVTLIGDTVTDNESDNAGTGPDSFAIGGGLGVGSPSSGQTPLKIDDTVIAGNKVVSDAGASAAKFPDIAISLDVEGVVKDSLIGAGKSYEDTFTKLTLGASDQVGTTAHPLNPKLGKLGPAGSKKATAGGALEVQKPEKGSRLIGKGAAKPFSTKAVPFKTDELGIARPAKGVTIGAYQVPPKKKHKKRHR